MKRAGLTAAGVEEKLRELDGNMAAVARAFGVTRQSVYGFCKIRPTLQQVLVDCREGMKDEAESSLQKALKSGEAWAVCFYLKTQAKDRGYVERSEHTGANGGPLQMQVIEEMIDGPADDQLPAHPSTNGVPA